MAPALFEISFALRSTGVAVRLAECAAVAALFICRVTDWGFRYYGLALILIAQLAASVWRAVRGGGARTGGGVVRRVVVPLVLLAVAAIPAIVFPQYEPIPVTGEYKVANTVYHFVDHSRIETYSGGGGGPRALAVEFWYPEAVGGAGGDGGERPLIVFSHGAFGIRSSNETLFRELASHGYVVCSIDHTYQCLYTRARDGKIRWMDSGYAREIRSEDAKKDKLASLELYRKWMGIRVADIDFVIDEVAARAGAGAEAGDQPFGMVDPSHIGVMGHSLGGSAALGIGRLRDDVDAVVALEAPFLCDIVAVRDGAFEFLSSDYPVPVLNIYSDSSWDHLDEWPQYEENARLLAAADGADTSVYNLHIAGAGHLTFTDLSLSSPILTRILNGHATSISARECLDLINRECLAFLDRCVQTAR